MADEPKTMRLRFRRTVQLAGATHQANTLAAVEATDEAWELVNRGEADLEPGPGEAGQPFPPEKLTRSEAPPAPLAGPAPPAGGPQQAAVRPPAAGPGPAGGPAPSVPPRTVGGTPEVPSGEMGTRKTPPEGKLPKGTKE